MRAANPKPAFYREEAGPKFVALYNDAYAPTIGAKHPRALGRPPRESWTELWDYLEPLLRRVLDTGETIFTKDRPFNIERWHRRPTSLAPARKARTLSENVLIIRSR